jgi:hypothetical protein
LGTEEAPEVAGWRQGGAEPSSARRRRPRHIPWGRWFLGAVAAAGLAWASLTPGGIGARLSGVDSSLSGAVADLTQSRALDKASKMFDGWYTQQGTYPRYSQSQLDEQGNANWSEGMDVTWCTPRDVVLISFTASGTVSRLLLDGKVVGDVPGRVGCPTDLVEPLPWKR